MKKIYILFGLLIFTLTLSAQRRVIYCDLFEEYHDNALERVSKIETVFIISNQSVRIIPRNTEHSELVRVNKSKFQRVGGSLQEVFKTVSSVNERGYEFSIIKDAGHLNIRDEKFDYSFSECKIFEIKD